MIEYATASTQSDLEGIMILQKVNLPRNLTAHQMQAGGFVTVSHTAAQLSLLNDIEPHIVAKDGDRVVGYLLAMTAVSRHVVPVLIPMFVVFDGTRIGKKPIAAYNYIVVGQVCIDKDLRGRGILDGCYAFYRKQYDHKYDFAITEIAAQNARSLSAHKRVGFVEVASYNSPDGVEWVIVVWNWGKRTEE